MKEKIRQILNKQGHGWSYLYLRLGLKSGSSFFRTLESKTVKLKTIEDIALVLKVPVIELFADTDKQTSPQNQ
jgi:hypothetical protein